MPTLNADIPPFEAWVDSRFLYDGEKHDPPLEPCTVFAVCGIPGNALSFHVHLHNTGAQFGRLPIHAIRHKRDSAPLCYETGHMLVSLWNAFSYELSVTEYGYLQNMRVKCALRDREILYGTYGFTVDWYGSSDAERPGPGGWKCHHVIFADNGWILALPNNRVLFLEPAQAVEGKERPSYRINTHTWSCEQGDRWTTSEGPKMFYGVKSSTS